ncbi:MAG: ATP-binding protein [Dichotomicrobium sp.]
MPRQRGPLTMAHTPSARFNRQSLRSPARLRRALNDARRAEPLEFEQLVVRYLIGVFTTSCAILSWYYSVLEAWQVLALSIFIPAAWLVAAGFMLHFALWPEQRIARRTATIVFDAVTLSLFIHLGGAAASIFFPVYLWVILGNGFRFGLPYMYASMAANTACFLFVVAFTPHWRADWALAGGVVLSLLIIPLYVSRLIRELRSAMAEAEAANRAKSDFLATMSHELRTPLNAIIGLSQVLDRTAQSPQDKMSVMSINSAANRLLEMVDTVLDFQKVENHAVRVCREPLDISGLLQDAEALLRPLAQRKRLRLHIRFATPIPAQVLGDRDHLKTVLLNLGSNAIKYTEQGRIRITVSHTEASTGAMLRFEVRDTGKGIPEDEHDRLFDRFAQTAGSRRGSEGGVGLGLSLCRSLVDLMGGRIGFSSRPGAGSTFWFEVPAEIAEQPAAPPDTASGVALLLGLEYRDRLDQALSAIGVDTGDAISNPRDFVKAHATSGDLWRFVLVVDEPELDARAISDIRHALMTAAIPPALIVTSRSHDLAEWANGQLRDAPEVDAALIATVAKWHGHKPRAPASDDQARPAVAPLSVLVADDNPFNREVARKLLSLEGHHVVLANTGEEALNLLLHGGVDVAFLDINMPGGDGIEICKDYQLAVEPEAHIPIIAMTADISKPTRETCLRAGMAAVLHKPVQINELRETLRAHVRPIAPAGATRRGDRDTAETPILDARQLDEMIALFGPDAFREDMAALFEADFERHLDALQAAISNGHGTAARDALHALKSCANTIGAARLAALCNEKRGGGTVPDPALAARIGSEYAAFRQALYAHMGAEVPAEEAGRTGTPLSPEAIQQSR